jgi:hypothetical protein
LLLHCFLILLRREAGFSIDSSLEAPIALIPADWTFMRFNNALIDCANLVAEATKAKYEKRFDEVFDELIEKIKGGMSAEAAIRSLK